MTMILSGLARRPGQGAFKGAKPIEYLVADIVISQSCHLGP
jgi:hypothetical protein